MNSWCKVSLNNVEHDFESYYKKYDDKSWTNSQKT